MTIRAATPVLPVADIDAACALLTRCFGFETVLRADTHAHCKAGGAALRLIKAPADADMDDPARQFVIYLDTDDVDALYRDHRAALDALPKGHLRPPFDRDYGMRECHAIHGPFLFIAGHSIAEPQP